MRLFNKVKSRVKGKRPFWLWLVIMVFIALPIDALDYTLGKLPIIGTGMDLIAWGIASVLFWPVGLLYGWEVFSIGYGNLADSYVPTCILIGLFYYIMGYVEKPNIRRGAKRIGKAGKNVRGRANQRRKQITTARKRR